MKILCERLRNHDSTLTRLILKDSQDLGLCNGSSSHNSESWQDLILALQESCHPYIQKVFLGGKMVQQIMNAGNDFENDNNDNNSNNSILSNLLVGGFAYLPNLQELEISMPWINAPTKIQGHELAHFLQKQQKLQSLIIWPYVSIRTSNDVQLIAESLENHPQLETLALMNLVIKSYSTTTTNNDNNRREEMSEQQESEQDNLEENEHENNQNIYLDPILIALTTIPTLYNLQLSAGVNSSNFKTKFKASPIIQNDINSICNLLQQPCRLRYLCLRNFNLTDMVGIAMAETLSQQKHRTELQTLDIRSNAFLTFQTYQAMHKMLKENYMLQWLVMNDDFVCCDEVMKQDVDFWLRVNRAGRHMLLRNVTVKPSECVQVMANAEDDLDVLYYLLRCNPSWINSTDKKDKSDLIN